jgi:dTDP-4-dehydrorhamnose 3,5-epimerase
MVSCIRGRIFDVAIDIRNESPTYLQWFGLELDDSSGKSLFIPEGFAHGFQSLEPCSEILYFVSAPYNKSSESGINALDPRISVNWPIRVSERSKKDSSQPMLEDSFQGVDLSIGII